MHDSLGTGQTHVRQLHSNSTVTAAKNSVEAGLGQAGKRRGSLRASAVVQIPASDQNFVLLILS